MTWYDSCASVTKEPVVVNPNALHLGGIEEQIPAQEENIFLVQAENLRHGLRGVEQKKKTPGCSVPSVLWLELFLIYRGWKKSCTIW
jgi:hypothetical protein